MSKNLFAARFQWLQALPLLIVTGALVVIAIGALTGDSQRTGDSKDRLFDFFQRIKPASSQVDTPFHVVRIDRESIEKIGPWPWPRTLLADVADKAREAGATGVVIVEPVDAPDPLSPQTIGDFWLGGARDADLARQLALLPDTDETLARALAQIPGAVGVAAAGSDPGADAFQRADASAADWLATSGLPGGYLALPAARARFPVNADLKETAQVAVAALPADRDGVLRRTTPLWALAGAPSPSMGLAAAQLAREGETVTAMGAGSTVNAAGAPPAAIAFSAREIPLGPDASMRLYLPRVLETASTPAWRLFEPRVDAGQLRGKVVIIGLDADQGGAVKTARGALSAPQAHALIAAQINGGDLLVRPGWASYLEATLVMLLGAAAIMWSQRLDFWRAMGVAALISLGLLFVSAASFMFARLLIDPTPAALALFLGAFSVAGGRSLGVVLRDDSVRGSFKGALPEPTMKKLREEGATEILDGDHRPLTILACELRLTDEDMEKLALMPDDVTKLIASACIDLRKAIIDTGGAAEQAEGGKVYAYFNAPLENADHVNAACSSALRLIESMDKINTELEASPRMRGVQLHLAIGVASGDCFVGPMGHGRNNRYSAIGPAVDMATFLRRQAEFYGPAIICDETVHRKTHHHFAFLELDKLKTNRSDHPTSIYALVGNPFIKSSKAYRSLEDTHRQLLAAYRSGDFAAARIHLAKAKESPGARIALFDIYEERIAKMAATGAPEDWDGAQDVIV